MLAQRYFVAVPSDSSWVLRVDGVKVEKDVALDWGLGFNPNETGLIELDHKTPSSHRLVILLQLLLWVFVLIGFLRSSVGSERSLL